MKHVLSILLALVSLAAVAQEATVKIVMPDPMNISASKYPMTDLNGRTAPLVIVRVLADNVEFKGSVLDGGVQKKTGEYWVYMGAGAKMLHIHSDRFLPVEINFPDYGIPRLEPSATYIITLTLPQAAAQFVVPHTPQATFSTTPVHLALCAIDSEDGAVYISYNEWQALSQSIRSSYKPLGVCLSVYGETFLVDLYDQEEKDWYALMKNYVLPTKAQAEIIAKDKDALNNVLSAVGGNELAEDWYWTKTDKGSSHAYGINMYNGAIAYDSKSYKLRARTISSVPAAQKVVFSTSPMHLALCATSPDGRVVYITSAQWATLPYFTRSSYKPLGLCLSVDGKTFLIDLRDKEYGKGMKWKNAMKYNLPTKEEGEIIARKNKSLNNALNAFRGDELADDSYWTGTEHEKYSSNAYYVDMRNHCINNYPKNCTFKVRAVAPVPGSSAM